MRTWVIALVILGVGVASFGAGYWIADTRGRALVAENQLAALQHYVPAIAYLRKGNIESAKGILYTGVDGTLTTLSQDNAASLSTTTRPILEGLLAPLNAAWSEDRPFEGEKDASLRNMPEWVEMRERNDAFRLNFATQK